MNKALAIARREIAERSFVFVAAIVITVAPLVALVVPRGTLQDRLSVFGILSVILATAFVAGLSLILGGSMIGRELTEKRLSFYFSRPVSGASIWFGKLTAAIAIIVASAVIVFIPSMFFLPRVTGTWFSGPAALGIMFGTCVILFLAAHTLSTMFRSRSPLLALDFAAAIIFAICVFAAIVPLLAHHAMLLAWIIASLAVGAFVVAIVFGGAFQLERGRVDARRNHRALSRFLWTTLAIALAVIVGVTVWVTSAGPRDLAGDTYVQQAPSGSWAFVAGQGAHRADYHAAFLVNTTNMNSIEVPATFAWSGAVNDTGTAAVGPIPTSTFDMIYAESFGSRFAAARLTSEIVTIALGETAKMNHTGIFLNGFPDALDVTPDGSRVALLDGQTLSVYDTATHKSLGSAALNMTLQRYERLRLRFASANEVLVYQTSRTPRVDRTVIDVRAFDVSKRALRTVMSEEITASNVFLKVSADGRSFLVRSFGQDSIPVRTFDLASGRELSSITSEPGARTISTWLLRDDRVAVTAIANGQAKLRVYRGSSLEREVPLGAASQARIVAMPAHDQFIVSTSDKAHSARQSVVVDLNRGVIATAPGMTAVGSEYYAIGAEDGNHGTAVYIGPNGTYMTWNPATGEKKPFV